jgi:hypothetical protein
VAVAGILAVSLPINTMSLLANPDNCRIETASVDGTCKLGVIASCPNVGYQD